MEETASRADAAAFAAAELAAPEIAIVGSAPAVVPEGATLLVELAVRNNGPDCRAVNVYVRSPGTPLQRLACRGAKTHAGKYHASALLSLSAGAGATLSVLIGPATHGAVIVRADAVYDDTSASTIVRTEIAPIS